jgi:hypothetical protein
VIGVAALAQAVVVVVVLVVVVATMVLVCRWQDRRYGADPALRPWCCHPDGVEHPATRGQDGRFVLCDKAVQR